MINGVWCDEYRKNQKDTNGLDQSYNGLVNRIKECVLYNHIPCGDMFYEIGFNEKNIYTYSEDGTHPKNGLQLLANRMVGYISLNRNWN